jgi:hypothetical protein
MSLFALFIESAPRFGLDGQNIVITIADHHGRLKFHLGEWTPSKER